jgi:hypothetical protein
MNALESPKIATPARNTVRRPKMSPSRPPVTSSTVNVSVYALTAHSSPGMPGGGRAESIAAPREDRHVHHRHEQREAHGGEGPPLAIAVVEPDPSMYRRSRSGHEARRWNRAGPGVRPAYASCGSSGGTAGSWEPCSTSGSDALSEARRRSAVLPCGSPRQVARSEANRCADLTGRVRSARLGAESKRRAS